VTDRDPPVFFRSPNFLIPPPTSRFLFHEESFQEYVAVASFHNTAGFSRYVPNHSPVQFTRAARRAHLLDAHHYNRLGCVPPFYG